jgi:hypothetical protein
VFESVCPACSRQVARRGVQLVPIHVTSVSEHAITHVPSFNAGRLEGRNVKGVFSPNTAFIYELAQLTPYELTHVRASPGDCAAGWAQAAR